MDVGTAKPSLLNAQLSPTTIDILDHCDLTVQRIRADATRLVAEPRTRSRARTGGGTMLFFKALLKGCTSYPAPTLQYAPSWMPKPKPWAGPPCTLSWHALTRSLPHDWPLATANASSAHWRYGTPQDRLLQSFTLQKKKLLALAQ